MAETYGMPGVEPLRLRTNGIGLHAVAAGPPDGPLVLLLHGFPECAYGWRRQIGVLAAAGLRVVAPDQRGYGLSDKPAGVAAYGLDALADDVAGIADALGRRRFSLVGHDWGGIVAWHLAARDSGRIDRLAVLNAPHPATLRRHMRAHPSQALRSWYAAAFQIPWLPERLLAAGGFAPLRTVLVRTARGPGTFTPEDLRRYRAAWEQPGAARAMLNWYRALARRGGGPAPSGRIGAPARVIWGDRDPFLDSRLAEAALALCDRGEAFHIPEATHWVQHEEPERVNDLLLGFLA